MPSPIVEFPHDADAELIAICAIWHGGQWSSMYSVLSTATIHDASVLSGLASELGSIVRSYSQFVQQDPDQYADLKEWHKWADEQSDLHATND